MANNFMCIFHDNSSDTLPFMKDIGDYQRRNPRVVHTQDKAIEEGELRKRSGFFKISLQDLSDAYPNLIEVTKSEADMGVSLVFSSSVSMSSLLPICSSGGSMLSASI